MSENKHIAIFASGTGSNAVKIIESFDNSSRYTFSIYCNNPQAGIIEKGKEMGIPVTVFNRKEYREGGVLKSLRDENTSFIVLAGFLWLVPQDIVNHFPNKIINIHPALLPSYGGKGMYGMFVHNAVIEAGDAHSGITIHYVNENYDEGQVILQEKCAIEVGDTPQILQKKVQKLEHLHFPKVVRELVQKLD